RVWGGSLADLGKASHIVLLGTDIYHRQPIIELRLRAALRRGTTVYVLSSEPQDIDRLATQSLRYAPGQTSAVARRLLGHVLAAGGARGSWAEAHTKVVEKLHATLSKPVKSRSKLGVDDEALRALADDIAQAPALTVLYDERCLDEPTGATLADDVRQ